MRALLAFILALLTVSAKAATYQNWFVTNPAPFILISAGANVTVSNYMAGVQTNVFVISSSGGTGSVSGFVVTNDTNVLTFTSTNNLFTLELANFSTNSSGSTNWREGRVFYDHDSHTLCFYNDQSNITVNISQEQHVRVLNKTGTRITNGNVVTIVGAQGDHPLVGLASAGTELIHTNFHIIGVATQDITNNDQGIVTSIGLVHDLNTAAFTAGDMLYLSTNPGEFTNVPPAATYCRDFVGVVLRSHANAGIIFVNPQQNPSYLEVTGLTNYIASLGIGTLAGAVVTNSGYTQQVGGIFNSAWGLVDTNSGQLLLMKTNSVVVGRGLFVLNGGITNFWPNGDGFVGPAVYGNAGSLTLGPSFTNTMMLIGGSGIDTYGNLIDHGALNVGLTFQVTSPSNTSWVGQGNNPAFHFDATDFFFDVPFTGSGSNLTLTDGLTVTSDANFEGNVNIGGSLVVSNDSSFSNTISLYSTDHKNQIFLNTNGSIWISNRVPNVVPLRIDRWVAAQTTNLFEIYSNGVPMFVVRSNGNVMSSGDIGAGGSFNGTNTINAYMPVGSTTGFKLWRGTSGVGILDASSYDFNIQAASQNLILTPANNYKVGVGSATPDSFLTVSNTTAATLFKVAGGPHSSNTLFQVNSNASVGIGVASPTAGFSLETASHVKIGGSLQVPGNTQVGVISGFGGTGLTSLGNGQTLRFGYSDAANGVTLKTNGAGGLLLGDFNGVMGSSNGLAMGGNLVAVNISAQNAMNAVYYSSYGGGDNVQIVNGKRLALGSSGVNPAWSNRSGFMRLDNTIGSSTNILELPAGLNASNTVFVSDGVTRSYMDAANVRSPYVTADISIAVGSGAGGISAPTVGQLKFDTYESGGKTRMIVSNEVVNVYSNLAVGLGGTFGAPVLSTSTSTNSPAATEFVVAEWVRGLFSGGTLLYNCTNQQNVFTNMDFWYSALPTTNTVQQARTYNAVTTGQYLGTGIASTNRYQQLNSPMTVNAYLSFNTGGGRSVSVHPEFYYCYSEPGTNGPNNYTNLLGDYVAGAQSLIAGTNLYTWVISFPTIVSTNANGFWAIRRFKVDAQTANPNVTIHGSGNTPSTIGFNNPTVISSGMVQYDQNSVITNVLMNGSYQSNTISTVFNLLAPRQFFSTNAAANITFTGVTGFNTNGEREATASFMASGGDIAITIPNPVRTPDGQRIYYVSNGMSGELTMKAWGFNTYTGAAFRVIY